MWEMWGRKDWYYRVLGIAGEPVGLVELEILTVSHIVPLGSSALD